MKRLLVLATFMIFAFACTPCTLPGPIAGHHQVTPPRNPFGTPKPKTTPLFSFMIPKAEDPVVDVSCPEDGSKCVPQYRLNDTIDEGSVGKAIKWIEAANVAGASEILFEMNTPGGSVPDGFELSKAIEDSKAPVTIICDGECDSMGAYILQSASKRYMTRRSKLMFHEPSLGGEFRGQPNQWAAIAERMRVERDALAEHCAHRMKISLKEYHNLTDGGKMLWMNIDEALKRYGAVDGAVVSVKELYQRMIRP